MYSDLPKWMTRLISYIIGLSIISIAVFCDLEWSSSEIRVSSQLAKVTVTKLPVLQTGIMLEHQCAFYAK